MGANPRAWRTIRTNNFRDDPTLAIHMGAATFFLKTDRISVARLKFRANLKTARGPEPEEGALLHCNF